MKKSDFCFNLPPKLIAQTPCQKRDMSRLLVLNKENGDISELLFKDVISHINKGDCIILNDTKVIPARLFAKKKDTGAAIEVVLLERKSDNAWETLVRPGKRVKLGTQLIFGDGLLTGVVTDTADGGNRIIEFTYDGDFYALLDEIGNMPLPPYITQKLDDKSRYQTVYAAQPGSAAAPTAGFHFTDELLGQIKEKGVRIGFCTLHVGLGTFRPVKVEEITDHIMHKEHYYMPLSTSQIISQTKKNGGNVIAVGTTSTRTIESIGDFSVPSECSGYTDIFIYPGYKFKVVDKLITNFHLPESTLIMLVSALAGRDNIMKAYEYAVDNKFRFFSFGDAMLII